MIQHDQVLSVMLLMFIATCTVLVAVAAFVAFVFVFLKIRDSNTAKEALESQKRLDQEVEKNLLGLTSIPMKLGDAPTKVGEVTVTSNNDGT